ncbi:MAG: hypothetical protein LBV40_06475 [Methanomicrobiales archaeon]|jgi:energy-converting hydrogenase A subunit H|nr:hypothetical protein [Methanomicrobiales archaeon]
MSNTLFGGETLLATIPFADIVWYLSPYTLLLFSFAVIFTILAIISRPERYVDTAFGTDGYYLKEIPLDQMRFQRFMAIACGLAAMGASVTGDIFNFTLFSSLVGICCIGIVSGVKNKYVLQAAYEYGIVIMIAGVPLFGGAALIAATTGTLSIFELSAARALGAAVTAPLIAKLLLIVGVMGEGMAPFYILKADIARAQGAPYILNVCLIPVLVFLRVIEIVLTI